MPWDSSLPQDAPEWEPSTPRGHATSTGEAKAPATPGHTSTGEY